MSRHRFALCCWIFIAALVGVILWGAYVRMSGSGAGCGNHWPLCNGEVIPRSPETSTVIEFVHRATSGLVLLGGLGLLWGAFQLFPRGHLVRKAAAATLLLLLSEAVLGAGLVIFELVKDDDSVARAAAMAFHLVNTFMLLAAATTAAVGANGFQPRRSAMTQSPQSLLLLSVGALVLVGASGAITALGDTLFPAASLKEAVALDFSAQAHFLVQLRIYHPLLALATAVLLLSTCSRVGQVPTPYRLRRLSTWVSVLVGVQVLAGVLNVWLLAPVWLQLTHLLLADLLWISSVSLLLVLSCRMPKKNTGDRIGKDTGHRTQDTETAPPAEPRTLETGHWQRGTQVFRSLDLKSGI